MFDQALADKLQERSIPEPNSGCWIWTAYVSASGYGAMCFRGKRQYAHRLSLIAKNGPIAPGLCVCHRCDNPLCINPDHLFLGSHRENMHDRDKKGRGVMPYMLRARTNSYGFIPLTQVS